MTQDELDALPECGGFGRDEGRMRLRAPADEPAWVDDHGGSRWFVGYGPDGIKYKRRVAI